MTKPTFKKCTNYTVKELEYYTSNANACVQKIEWINIISLLPRFLGNIREGIRFCLSQKIGLYDRSVDGVILAFTNVKILNPLSANRPGSIRLFVKIKVDFFVFRPLEGAIIAGTVKYVSTNYLSVIIYRVFNVTIKLNQKKLHGISPGNEISFVVKSYDLKSDLPFIEGELIQEFDDECSAEVISAVKIDPEVLVDISYSSDSTKDNCIKRNGRTDNRATKKVKKERKIKHENGMNEDISDNEIEDSINAILNSFSREFDNENGCEDTPTASTSKRKRKNKRKYDEMESESYHRSSPKDCQNNSTELGSVKKRKKKIKTEPIDDFEEAIMSSILKIAAEAEKQESDLDATDGKKKRKSVRFDDEVKASLNGYNSSSVSDLSYIQSSSTKN